MFSFVSLLLTLSSTILIYSWNVFLLRFGFGLTVFVSLCISVYSLSQNLLPPLHLSLLLVSMGSLPQGGRCRLSGHKPQSHDRDDPQHGQDQLLRGIVVLVS